ncbi:3-hydroxyacyl-CoA dehydrogenase NAD-binding domain-containing protein [Pelagibacterium sediminicola]|uniref:3-hydroxyacyl-CoA dehydrogenase NAD-binding domain-containing protein n=1 Tax=Pelagibacterium sediminicola TaxID=2248761 RepID=UPI000E319EF5|nr:3-hydroxyacyl-CoA dehydrogenase NAD-binding domain-containing protein [Pelagibacterium sediminicola]
MKLVTLTRDAEIAIVTVSNPPVNALSQALREQLLEVVGSLGADAGVRGVVLLCAGRTFIAGADVNEFDKPPAPPHLPDLVAAIENAPQPWLAAIHGAALGGGLEVALGCRFRLAARNASLGFPEVALGVIPGASGTVRTPRLIGVNAAVDLITSGKPISAPEALAVGLVDEVIDGELMTEAVSYLREALHRPLPPAISQRPQHAGNFAWEAQRQILTRRARGELAPLKALESIEFSTTHDFDEAMAFERRAFLELRTAPQAAALRHVFLAERAALRPADLKDIASLPIEQIGVVGGGTMGIGITAAFLDAGLTVTLVERDLESAQRAKTNLKALYQGTVKRGRLSHAEAEARLARFSAISDLTALAAADLVIEAVFEDIAIKQELFGRLDRICRPDAILATNTSYLDPRAIAEPVSGLERFIGLHFFSPANIMKLLEIVPLAQTSQTVLATAISLARRLGKIPVRSGVCEGFVGNRILKRYRAAAEDLVRRGISIAEIDAAMRDYGFAMGPFEAQDLGGLDIAFAQREAARSAGTQIAETLGDILVRAGRKGQKVGAGWYDYVSGSRTPVMSEDVMKLLAGSVGPGKTRTRQQIADSLVAEMAAEGERILAEGIVRQAADIDLVEIHGYGFPRWRGGPMFVRSVS